MKLNYRDRILLTILIVIFVWAIGVMFFIKPAIEGLQDSQTALDNAKSTRSDLKKRIKEDEGLPDRIKEAYNEVTKMTESFYDIQETQVASQQIDDLLASDEITNLDITISPYSNHPITPYVYVDPTIVTESDLLVEGYVNEGAPVVTPETAPAEGEVVAAPAAIGSYEITFNFKGKVDKVQEFCDHMKSKNDQKTMTVSSISYQFEKEEKEEGKEGEEYSEEDVSGSCTLTMMVVKKLPNPDTLGNSKDSKETKETKETEESKKD